MHITEAVYSLDMSEDSVWLVGGTEVSKNIRGMERGFEKTCSVGKVVIIFAGQLALAVQNAAFGWKQSHTILVCVTIRVM